MSKYDDKQWFAYIDGELTATESASLDNTLSPEARECLGGEMKFEHGLSELLNVDTLCPQAVWSNTLAALSTAMGKETPQEEKVIPFSLRRNPAIMWFVRSAAAVAVVMLLLQLLPSGDGPDQSVFAMAAQTPDELALTSQVVGNHDEVLSFLHANGIRIDMDPLPEDQHYAQHHSVMLLGARKVEDGMVEVLFGCCDAPLKVVLGNNDSDIIEGATRLMTKRDGEVRKVELLGSYVAVVVGRHHMNAITDLFHEI